MILGGLKLNSFVKQTAALTISYIFMPTTFALITFVVLAFSTRQSTGPVSIAVVSVLFGAAIPFALLIYLVTREKVSRWDVPVRQERTKPYLVSVAIYLAGFLVLFGIGASVAVYALMFCYAANTLIIAIINSRWKISAHAMGASGPLTALALVFGWKEALPLFLLVLLVAWARVELKAHTKFQVAAGAILGILLTALQMGLFYRLNGIV